MLVVKVPWKQHTLPMRSIFISLDCEEGFWRGCLCSSNVSNYVAIKCFAKLFCRIRS